MIFEKEFQTAITAAKNAGKYLKDNQEKVIIQQQKNNNKNYATKQDIQSDKIIIDTIRSNFPNDPILSEESTPKLKNKTRIWIIDPLDGTRNYANGLPYYSISIVLFQDEELKLGVVYAPSYNNELYHAVKGQGAFLNNKSLETLNQNQTLNSSIIATGFVYFKGKELKKPLELYEKVLNQSTDVVRFGSAALDLCHVATGRIGAYFESGLKPWDLAAGILILQEQKGIISDYKNNKLDIFKSKEEKFSIDILSSQNNTIHSELSLILKK